MKKVLILSAFAALIVACGGPSASTHAKDAQDVNKTTGVNYTVTAKESSLSWKGTKPSGSAHTGTVAIASGTLNIADNAVVGGSFEADLTKMTVTDEGMDDKSKGKLVGHLSNGDFFEVEKYPTAKFDITSATADSLTGNLIIKDVSKSITIPYTMSVEGDAVIASSAFSMDRTQWGITYNSGNFFENLGDYMIDDILSLEVKLTANK